jgi:hypothetical protein
VAFKAFAALTAASAVRPAPALALFGLGGDPIAKYTEQTTAVIEQVKYTLDLPTDSPDKAGAIEKTQPAHQRLGREVPPRQGHHRPPLLRQRLLRAQRRVGPLQQLWH